MSWPPGPAVTGCAQALSSAFRTTTPLLTFAAAGPAPLASEGTGDPIFATLWTLIGAPAYSLPLMTGAKGMPVGVQAVAAPGRDRELTRAAAWLMRACVP